MNTVITIDGSPVHIPAHATLLDAFRQQGIPIPTLCHSPLLSPSGACRLCLVATGQGQLVTACSTQAVPGASYFSNTPAVIEARRQAMALILRGHPLACRGCHQEGDCQLEQVACGLGFTPVSHTPLPAPDRRHPFIHHQPELCIACGRCVRACAEIEGRCVLAFMGRGQGMRLVAGAGEGLEAAGCAACGQCLFECPTGALIDAQKPVGVGPERVVATTCGYCAVGCRMQVSVAHGRILSVQPDRQGSANRGHLCVKGRFAHAFTHSPDRLTAPLIRTPQGTFRQSSWEEALALVAERFLAIRAQHGPQSLGTVSSARCTNEENFLLQKFTRVAFGSNNIDNCARVCHSPSAFALGESLGTGAGTNSFEDVERSQLLLVVGANPTEAHPVLGARIRRAVEKGCQLLVLDPRKTELARQAHLHLQLTPGSNGAVINALQWVLLEEGLIDEAFITAHAEGLPELRAALAGCTPEWAQGLSGVPARHIRQAARLYGQSPRAQILWGLGVTESCNGTVAAFGLINMAVLTGNLGRPGTGASPIRGQNNVQGACDMGALPNVFSDYRSVSDPQARQEHQTAWGVPLPTAAGMKMPEMLAAAREERLKGLYLVAQDPAQSDPHTRQVEEALHALDFLVVQELFMSESARFAHVILPGASFFEKSGTFVNSDRRVQPVNQAVPPPGHALPDGEIVNRMARAMGVDLGCDHGPGTPMDPSQVFAEITRLTPHWRGMDMARILEKGFLQWPCPHPGHPGTDIVHRDGQFLRGKARLTPTRFRPPMEGVDEDYPLLLTTGRTLFHYNVGSMTRRTPMVHLQAARREHLRLHPEDALDLGVAEGERVVVVSRQGRLEVTIQLDDGLRPGICFMAFHFPESRTNRLVGQGADEYTQCPEYKVTPVRIDRIRRMTI